MIKIVTVDEMRAIEAAADKAIAACDGDMRATIRALILANEFLEASSSKGYRRGVVG